MQARAILNHNARNVSPGAYLGALSDMQAQNQNVFEIWTQHKIAPVFKYVQNYVAVSLMLQLLQFLASEVEHFSKIHPPVTPRVSPMAGYWRVMLWKL